MPDGISGSLQYIQAALLLLIGLHGMLVRPHLVRKLMAMNVLQVAVIVFFIALAAKSTGTAPVLLGERDLVSAEDYVNPLPHALMLTAIVVSVSTTGVALALLIRIRRRYGTLREDALLDKLRE